MSWASKVKCSGGFAKPQDTVIPTTLHIAQPTYIRENNIVTRIKRDHIRLRKRGVDHRTQRNDTRRLEILTLEEPQEYVESINFWDEQELLYMKESEINSRWAKWTSGIYRMDKKYARYQPSSTYYKWIAYMDEQTELDISKWDYIYQR